MITAIGVSAAATLAASSMSADATTSAANTAANEQRNALSAQMQMSQPYRDLGTSAIPQLQSLLGLTGGPGGGAGNAATQQAALAATPGYQFTLAQGLQGVQNSAAAKGMLKSGNTLEALNQYGAGLADQTYQQEVQDLQNVVGMGQAAAAGQAAQIGQAGQNLGNIAIGQGQNIANIDMSTVAGLSNLAGNYANANILSKTLAGLKSPGGVAGGGGGPASPVPVGGFDPSGGGLGMNADQFNNLSSLLTGL